jgi:cell division protein FtsB
MSEDPRWLFNQCQNKISEQQREIDDLKSTVRKLTARVEQLELGEPSPGFPTLDRGAGGLRRGKPH